MGRERDVLRWDIHDALLRARLAAAERALVQMGEPTADRNQQRRLDLERELAEVHRLIDRLGPSPRAKMG